MWIIYKKSTEVKTAGCISAFAKFLMDILAWFELMAETELPPFFRKASISSKFKSAAAESMNPDWDYLSPCSNQFKKFTSILIAHSDASR